jgi:hypothetical protein
MKFSSLLPMALFALTIAMVVRANDQQMQQAAMNAAVCLLAIRAGSTDRRSDLQAHHKSLVFGSFGRVSWLAFFAAANVLGGNNAIVSRNFFGGTLGDLDYGACAGSDGGRWSMDHRDLIQGR